MKEECAIASMVAIASLAVQKALSCGRDLRVNKAKPREDRGSSGGNRGGYSGVDVTATKS